MSTLFDLAYDCIAECGEESLKSVHKGLPPKILEEVVQLLADTEAIRDDTVDHVAKLLRASGCTSLHLHGLP